jgi:hypothetical protein
MTVRWIVHLGVFIVISNFPAITFAQTNLDARAQSVTASCKDALKRTDRSQTFDEGLCLGILNGFTTSAKTPAFLPLRVSDK